MFKMAVVEREIAWHTLNAGLVKSPKVSGQDCGLRRQS